MTGDGTSRWFGKTNLVIGQDGCVGLYIDHAVSDGHSHVLLERILSDGIKAFCTAPPSDRADAAQPIIVPSFAKTLELQWCQAVDSYMKNASRLCSASESIRFDTPSGVPMASLVTLAGQAAFYNATGRLEPAYVPVSRTHQALSGLEFVYGIAPGTEAFFSALAQGVHDGSGRLRNLLNWWQQEYMAAMHGPLGERAVQYLFEFAKARGVHGVPVFRSAGYPQRLAYPPLCFSILHAGKSMPAPLFPPVEGGWGIGAVPHSDGVNLTVTSWGSDSCEALTELKTSFYRMIELLEA